LSVPPPGIAISRIMPRDAYCGSATMSRIE